jgi:hypothetical protein
LKEAIKVARGRIVKDPPKRGSLTRSQIQNAAESVVYGLTKDTHYVIQSDKGGWHVKRGGGRKLSRHFQTKSEAVRYGREVSRNQKTEFVICHKNGKTVRSHSTSKDV